MEEGFLPIRTREGPGVAASMPGSSALALPGGGRGGAERGPARPTALMTKGRGGHQNARCGWPRRRRRREWPGRAGWGGGPPALVTKGRGGQLAASAQEEGGAARSRGHQRAPPVVTKGGAATRERAPAVDKGFRGHRE